MKSRFIPITMAVVLAALVSTGAQASTLSIWDSSWTQIGADDGHIGPGGGGQAFDAEYLYYKVDGNTLYLGLQSGFNLIDGNQFLSTYGGHTYNDWYYAGDLALSFDGIASTYEYGVDFGFTTRDYSGRDYSPTDFSHTTGFVESSGPHDGTDAAGLYSVSGWNPNTGIYYQASNPFAIDAGAKVVDLLTNISGSGDSGGGNTSYYRIVSFDISDLNIDGIDAHWTMSCGNDAINGRIDFTHTVPEPGTLSLMGLGLVGLGFMRRRKAKA